MRNPSSHLRSAGVAIVVLALARAGCVAQDKSPPGTGHPPAFALVEQYPVPVIQKDSPGAEGIGYGFEGGRVIKLVGTYHLFTTENLPGHMWVKTRLAHWSSTDRIHWKRVSTLYESSGDFTGRDPRASLWAPMPVYNDGEGRWNLFYVAYRCAPSTKTEWRGNYEGRIWRAVSQSAGRGGIGGPYRDVGAILQPDADSQFWEGLQGTDSFFPYWAGGRWLGFYGSANTEHLLVEHWRVGLAEAPVLAGPWMRRREGNPVNLEKRFAENPVVTRLDSDDYVTVYDDDIEYPNSIGMTWSNDGIHWAAGKPIVVQPHGTGRWADVVRTPLGLIPEGMGRYTVFYTGYKKSAVGGRHIFGAVGFVILREVDESKAGR